MKRLALAFLALSALLSTVGGQPAGRKVSLLVANCKAGERVCHNQELASYHFVNGEFVSKEVILSSSTDRVRYDLGENLIFRNRYVVTRGGDIIDVRDGKLVHEGVGEFVGTEGDQIFQKVNRIDLEGVFVFDLSKNKYARVESPGVWNVEGTLSPDKSKVARFQVVGVLQNSFSTAIVIEQAGQKKILKSELGAACSERCRSTFNVPFIWIDDERILTQRSNGDFIVLSLDGKVEPLFKIRSDKIPDSLPRFSRTEGGGIHYHWNGKNFWLDLENRTFKEGWVKLGNGFDMSQGEGAWKTVYFEGREVGKIWGDDVRSTRDFIALAYADEGENLGHPRGFKVWNGTKKAWTTIDVAWGLHIIGWLEG